MIPNSIFGEDREIKTVPKAVRNEIILVNF